MVDVCLWQIIGGGRFFQVTLLLKSPWGSERHGSSSCSKPVCNQGEEYGLLVMSLLAGWSFSHFPGRYKQCFLVRGICWFSCF